MSDVAKRIKKKLTDEIQLLEKELHEQLPKDLKTARAHGDLSENAEYKYAKERQSFVSARLAQLYGRMASVSMMSLGNLPHDRIAYGSRVWLQDPSKAKGGEIEYKLVSSEEADAPRGLISTTSPIGRALLGKVTGDEVRVQTPAGLKVFEIVRLLTIYEDELADSGDNTALPPQ